MAPQSKHSRPSRIRHCIETECETKVEEAFSRTFQRMHELLSPSGTVVVDNGTIMNAMFNTVEPTTSPQMAQTTLSPFMMRNSCKALVLDRLLYAYYYG